MVGFHGKSPSRGSEVPSLLLFIILLFLHLGGYHSQSVSLDIARADNNTSIIQPAPNTTTSLNNSQIEVAATTTTNPDVSLLADAFKTDVMSELPQEDLAQDALDFEWDKLLNTSTSAPFVSCAGNGRPGVRAMLGNFSEESVTPFYSTRDKNLTCYVIYSSAPTVLNVTSGGGGPIRYAAPVPTVLKVSNELFTKAYTGSIFQVPPSTLSAVALRVVFAPGVGDSFSRVSELVYGYRQDLRNGSFKGKIAQDFLWSPSSPPSPTTNASTRARPGERVRQWARSSRGVDFDNKRPWWTRASNRVGNATLGNQSSSSSSSSPLSANESIRASQWLSRLDPVLNGTFNCSYRRLNYAIEKPYLRITQLDTLLPSKPKPGPNTTISSNEIDHAASCLTALIAYLVSDPSVFYLEEFPRVQIVDQWGNYIVQSAVPGAYPLTSYGVDGSNQVIQITDTGLDMNHCFFKDSTGNVRTTTYDVAAFDSSRRKVIQYVVWADSTDVASGHGTHVNGIAAGSSTDVTVSNYIGAARGAKLAFFDVGDSSGQLKIPSNLSIKLFPPGYKAGARIFSNSWGSIVSSYTYLDAEMDDFMATNWDALIVTAAGNDGYQGLGTQRSPALNKNGLTIGASESARVSGADYTAVASFSSLGWSPDGRIKPDVVAPGLGIISSRAGTACSTVTMSGTSMATPLAAGSAALVRQYYQDGWYPTGSKVAANGFNPSGALVKATIINSAVGMKYYRISSTTTLALKNPPDQYQGHGRIKLDEVLNFAGSVDLFVADRVLISEKGIHSYKFTIPLVASTSQPIKSFKVTLVWTEPAATANSAYPVFHNLDLYVTSDAKKTTTYANGKSGLDAINTVEKVMVQSPQPGDVLTAYVKGTSISTTTSQSYSLVASGDFFSAAWFCQNPSSKRTDSSHRTSNCFLPCAQLSKNPVCCSTRAGDICTTKEILLDTRYCDARSKPWDCVSPLTGG